MGLRPLLGPPCIPPEAPPKRAFNFLSVTRATRPSLRELPSLAKLAQVISLRAALMPATTFALNGIPLQPTSLSSWTNYKILRSLPRGTLPA